MNEQTVKITPDGDVYFLYDDKSPLRDLGKLDVRRASEVFWAESDQRWKVAVFFPDGSRVSLTKSYVNRADAIQAEITALSTMVEVNLLKPEEMFL